MVLFIATHFGSPKYRGKSVSDIVERALRDAENYISGGVHGLIIENHGDIPFSKPEDIGHETSALMAVITEKVRERFAVPLGINVLANAAIPAMAIALGGRRRFRPRKPVGQRLYRQRRIYRRGGR